MNGGALRSRGPVEQCTEQYVAVGDTGLWVFSMADDARSPELFELIARTLVIEG